MVFHDTTPKPCPPRFCSCTVHLVISADFKTVCSIIYKFCGLFTLPFFTFLPIVAIELTENQCQSVCVCVTPCAKGFTATVTVTTIFQSRGVWPSCPTTRNEAVDKKGLLTKLFHSRFDSWWFPRYSPHKQVSHSRLLAAVRRSSAAVASLQMRTNLLLKTPSI